MTISRQNMNKNGYRDTAPGLQLGPYIFSRAADCINDMGANMPLSTVTTHACRDTHTHKITLPQNRDLQTSGWALTFVL